MNGELGTLNSLQTSLSLFLLLIAPAATFALLLYLGCQCLPPF